MAMLYPRRVEIRRAKPTGAGAFVGDGGYSGVINSPTDPNGYTVIATAIPASIQAGPSGRKKDSALAQDVVYAPTWFIFIPKRALALGTVSDRDYVADLDGENCRYEVGQAYWNLLGYKLVCIREQA